VKIPIQSEEDSVNITIKEDDSTSCSLILTEGKMKAYYFLKKSFVKKLKKKKKLLDVKIMKIKNDRKVTNHG
jgi:hypothetical protein